MAETKPIRLAKAAKTLNVGTSTIVEHLEKKGYEVENKPTSKLSPEMYNELLKEFQSEINIKEEAEQITLGSKNREDIELEKDKIAAPKRKDDGTDVLITNIGGGPVASEEPKKEEEKEPEKKVEEEKVVERKKVELDGPTVVGKIDLKKEEKAKEEKVEEVKEEKPATKPKEKVEEEKVEEKVIETKKIELDGPKIVGKITLKEKPKPDPKKEAEKKEEAAKKQRKRKRIFRPAKVDQSKDRGRSNRNKTDEPAQVSEKEIQEKIKATMAKLAGSSGKSARSKHKRVKRQAIAEEAIKEQEQTNDKLLQITEFISVSELASLMNVSATQVISTCMNLGVIVSINQRLDAEIIELVADEFEYQIEFISVSEQDDEDEIFTDDPEDLEERAPIVTIMGHVDHGKTSLLDYIREANVASGEAGGITQHIGAYEVTTEGGKKITFLDTPGHEAFTAMRARGAKLTDVAVIVVAADDAVMPQTKEAISHAQSAGVPMIFAINKMDKDGANPEKIKEQLAGMNILVEDWGGKFQSQELSAKTGANVDKLLEKILLESELLELKANPDREAIGAVIESHLDKGRGYVTNLLVQTGNMEIGDVITSGSYYGRIKAMFDHKGQSIKTAGPSTPIQMLGLNGAPQAGERFKKYESEQEAKNIANKRSQIEREQGLRTQKHITLDEIGRRLALGTFKELNLIIKGDVDGSVEALSDSLQKLSTEEVQVNVIHRAVGQISESDVLLASASDAIIVGFQVRPAMQARKLAEAENIEIRTYSIIYNAIEEIKSAMEGLLEPKIEEKITANIEVRDTFKITKVGTVAGCYVSDGKIKRNDKIRLIREGIVVYSGELASLKRFKEDTKEVVSGMECGLNIKDFNDIKVGDVIEAYEEIEVQRTL